MIPNLRDLLDGAVAGGVAPAIQACVIHRGELLHTSAHGAVQAGATTADTLFDVASLTKVVATTSLAYSLLSLEVLGLEDRALHFLPELAGSYIQEIRVRHLLAHTSGLPAWRPLFTKTATPDRQAILDAAATEPLEHLPGAVCVYSDLGFILLGEILARAGGASLDQLCTQTVFEPLSLGATSYRPLAAALPPRAIAPTGLSRPRPPAPGQEGSFVIAPPEDSQAPEPPGQVDDDNAWAMGGVAGHAGLFSTAEDVASWGAAILAERGGVARLGRPDLLRQLLRPDPHEGPPRALGFDLPSGPAPSVGTRFGAGPSGAVGHLGFTGCSIWLDLDREIAAALLTNRVFPSRQNVEGIRALRPAFHDAIVQALEPSIG